MARLRRGVDHSEIPRLLGALVGALGAVGAHPAVVTQAADGDLGAGDALTVHLGGTRVVVAGASVGPAGLVAHVARGDGAGPVLGGSASLGGQPLDTVAFGGRGALIAFEVL